MTAAPPVHTLRVSSAPAIAVDYTGQGDLVLFLHGIGGHRSNWTEQLQCLAPYFLAAAWDVRGYGDSDDYEGPMNFADLAQDVQRVLAHFGRQRAHFVGLSMGGRILVELHARYPETILSMVLVDTYPAQYPAARREHFLSLRQQPLTQGSNMSDIAPAIARHLVSPHADARVTQRLIDSMGKARKPSYMKAVAAGQAFDRWDHLKHIDVPTLLIAGEDDPLTPPQDMQEMAGEIPGARLEVIPRAGHLSNMEQPEAFNRLLIDFLLPLREEATHE